MQFAHDFPSVPPPSPLKSLHSPLFSSQKQFCAQCINPPGFFLQKNATISLEEPIEILYNGNKSIHRHGQSMGKDRCIDMGQIKRNRKQIASTVDPELWEAFRSLSDKTRIPASRLLDEAMEDLLLKYKVISHKEKTP